MKYEQRTPRGLVNLLAKIDCEDVIAEAQYHIRCLATIVSRENRNASKESLVN